jgi:hypothetical protein
MGLQLTTSSDERGAAQQHWARINGGGRG